MPTLLLIIFFRSSSDPCANKATGYVASSWPRRDVPEFTVLAVQFPSLFLDSCILSSEALDDVSVRTLSQLVKSKVRSLTAYLSPTRISSDLSVSLVLITLLCAIALKNTNFLSFLLT